MLVLMLSSLAGAVHVIAPDHWMPLAMVSWQQGWSVRKSISLAASFYLLHVIFGVVLYLGFSHFFEGMEKTPVFALSLTLMFGVMGLRYYRFKKLNESVGGGPEARWSLKELLICLGPAEALIPLLLKSGNLGTGYLIPAAAFYLGTLMSGTTLVVLGRVLWNQPFLLPRTLDWARRKAAVLPALAGLILGFSAIIKSLS